MKISPIAGVPVDAARGPWTITHSGGRFYFLDPRPEDVSIQSIAAALSKICRYNGHCRQFYSVAEHSTHASFRPRVLSVKRWALLHDAAEAYVGDMVRPLKQSLPQFREIEDRIMAAIAERFDLGPFPEEVREIDMRLCATEKRDLMPGAEDWPGMPKPYRDRIRETWGPVRARTYFLDRFRELFRHENTFEG